MSSESRSLLSQVQTLVAQYHQDNTLDHDLASDVFRRIVRRRNLPALELMMTLSHVVVQPQSNGRMMVDELLQQECDQSRLDVIQLLLQGANPDADEGNAFTIALHAGRMDVFEMLWAARNVHTPPHPRLLLWACQKNQFGVVQRLLDAGVDANADQAFCLQEAHLTDNHPLQEILRGRASALTAFLGLVLDPPHWYPQASISKAQNELLGEVLAHNVLAKAWVDKNHELLLQTLAGIEPLARSQACFEMAVYCLCTRNTAWIDTFLHRVDLRKNFSTLVWLGVLHRHHDVVKKLLLRENFMGGDERAIFMAVNNNDAPMVTLLRDHVTHSTKASAFIQALSRKYHEVVEVLIDHVSIPECCKIVDGWNQSLVTMGIAPRKQRHNALKLALMEQAAYIQRKQLRACLNNNEQHPLGNHLDTKTRDPKKM